MSYILMILVGFAAWFFWPMISKYLHFGLTQMLEKREKQNEAINAHLHAKAMEKLRRDIGEELKRKTEAGNARVNPYHEEEK